MSEIVQIDTPQSTFRIQRLSDFKEIGLGNAQYEKPWLRDVIKKTLRKKIGVFSKRSGLVAYHWKGLNKGYPENFIEYYTYGKH